MKDLYFQINTGEQFLMNLQQVKQIFVDDFIKNDIIEKQDNTYVFTKKGEKLVESIGK
jgi:predicted transcriptional regulator